MKKRGLYIQLFSIHGLIRNENVELGRDSDTGGQVKYVLELAKALSERKDVRKVDLFTRLIADKTVSKDYAQRVERINDKSRIVRIRCGGKKYIRKEQLWSHLDEFVDKVLRTVKGEGDIPDVVHGHYADAGYVALEISTLWGIPFVFTAHSLGRVKKQDMQNAGMKLSEMNKKFNIDHRIAVEEEIIGKADFIVTSTTQESRQQYGLYNSADNADYKVIPPGIDLDRFHPFYDELDPAEEEEREKLKLSQFFMKRELERFFMRPEKPLILTLSRPDYRKNIPALVTAYGQDQELQAIANLAIFAGIRKDISAMDESEREVLTELLLLMDKFDLYGKLAIPKRHDVVYDVPVLYRKVAMKNGVFVNASLKENFGLTLIEAAASGLPIVATDDGGPRDIIRNCQNGILVDASQPREISKAIKKILVDQQLWKKYSQNGIQGVRQHYAWASHCKKYVAQLKRLRPDDRAKFPAPQSKEAIGKKFTKIKKLFVTDIDDTLIGDDEALRKLVALLEENRSNIAFGVATGRPVESTQEVLRENNVPAPDFIISSVGTEIYYGTDLLLDKGWQTHIAAQWDKAEIKSVLDQLPFLDLQGEDAQREFKLSYFLDDSADRLADIHDLLSKNRLRYNLIFSSDCFLDIIPNRASKGKAIRYLHYKWNILLRDIFVAGDSENDEDMLRGEMLAVVVGNHQPGLDKLKGRKNIYFSPHAYAGGILDGLEHYRFIRKQENSRPVSGRENHKRRQKKEHETVA